MQFIDAWKIFAFCHDIGYPFEKLVNLDGSIPEKAKGLFETYREFGIEVEFDQILRTIAALMFVTVICSRSRRSLRDLLSMYSDDTTWHHWESKDSKTLNIMDLSNPEWDEYLRLDSIYSEDDLNCLYPFIKEDDVLKIIRNRNDNVLGFELQCSNGRALLWIGDDSEKEKYYLRQDEEYTYEYYCKNPSGMLKSRCIQFLMYRFYGEDSWLAIATHFCEPEICLLTNNRVDCRNVIHKIYTKLRLNVSVRKKDEFFEANIRNVGKEPNMVDIVLEKLKEDIKYIDDDREKYELAFERVCAAIDGRLKDTEFYQSTVCKIAKTINPALNRDNTISNMLIAILKTVYFDNNVCNLPQLFTKNSVKGQYCCRFNPFEYPGAKSAEFGEVHQKVLAELKKYLVEMSILPADQDISFFSSYTNDITLYDHGILGVHLLMYVMIAQRCRSNMWGFNIGDINYKRLRNVPNPKRAILESLGAIMIHNIYTDTYKNKKGISYLLTLDAHPLAYFGALCDVLQIWDRHHSVDQARCILKDFNPTRSEVSVSIHEKKIVITCETDNHKRSGDVQRNNLDQYLKYAGQLLKVNLIEDPF